MLLLGRLIFHFFFFFSFLFHVDVSRNMLKVIVSVVLILLAISVVPSPVIIVALIILIFSVSLAIVAFVFPCRIGTVAWLYWIFRPKLTSPRKMGHSLSDLLSPHAFVFQQLFVLKEGNDDSCPFSY